MKKRAKIHEHKDAILKMIADGGKIKDVMDYLADKEMYPNQSYVAKVVKEWMEEEE